MSWRTFGDLFPSIRSGTRRAALGQGDCYSVVHGGSEPLHALKRSVFTAFHPFVDADDIARSRDPLFNQQGRLVEWRSAMYL